MFEAFTITLREGIEAALIISLVYIFLQKSGQLILFRPTLWGVAAAVVASLLGAYFFQYLPINEEAYEGIVYFLAAFFIITMVIWMVRHGAKLKETIETKVTHITQVRTTSWQAQLGMFLFSFIMVFREGIETVLFFYAILLTEKNAALTLVGGVAGLACAIVFGFLLARGSIHISLKPFFRLTSWLLVLIAAQLVVLGCHEFFEAGLLPGGEQEMAIVGPFVRSQTLFWMVFLLLPLMLLLRNTFRTNPTVDPTRSPTEQRQQLAKRKQSRRLQITLIGFALIILLTMGYVYQTSIPKAGPPPVSVSAEEGVIRIPTTEVADNTLHIFSYHHLGIPIRFMVIQTAPGKFATALDGCQICGDVGYTGQGSRVICLHCTAEIPLATLGQPGGCNPIPLPSQRVGDTIRIATADLINISSDREEK